MLAKVPIFLPRHSANIPAPGIGRFAIFDEALVSEADLGVNFFVDDSCLGKSRSQTLTEMLLELNPEVQGSWYPNEVGSREPGLDRRPALLTTYGGSRA